MRDPARIQRVLAKLAVAWALDPDLRLAQLVSNLRGLGPQEDLFYWEDGDLEAALDGVLAAEGINPGMELLVFAEDAGAIEEARRRRNSV